VQDIFARDAWFRWRYNIRLQAATAEHWLRLRDLNKAQESASRLQETATEFEAHKYMCVAHKLMAQLEVSRGNLREAEKQLNAALQVFREYPAPLTAWRTYGELGRLELELGDTGAAQQAFGKAAEIVNLIAANTAEKELRETFMNSAPVKEVMKGNGQ
jgi:tetratricopeptide (TPR) repeat protein